MFPEQVTHPDLSLCSSPGLDRFLPGRSQAMRISVGPWGKVTDIFTIRDKVVAFFLSIFLHSFVGRQRCCWESIPDWGLPDHDCWCWLQGKHCFRFTAFWVATLKTGRVTCFLLPSWKKKSKSTMGLKLCRADSYHLLRPTWGNAHILRFQLRSKAMQVWGFPGGLVVRILGFHCSGLDSTSGQGTGTPQAKQHGQMNKWIKWFIQRKCVVI